MAILDTWSLCVLVLFLLSELVEGHKVASHNGQTLDSGRVVGGKRTDQKYFPFLVSIQKKKKTGTRHVCGGSIVNPTWILTACHCIAHHHEKPRRYKPVANYVIVAGVTNWQQDTFGRQEVGAENFIAHDHCVKLENPHPYSYYDVGLIKLQSPLMYSPRVQPMKLPSTDVDAAIEDLRRLQEDNALCHSPGWGRIQLVPEARSPQLKVAHQTLYPAKKCHKRICPNRAVVEGFAGVCSNLDLNEQICTFSNDASNCRGDSGGPLVCHGFVFGTVSQSKCTIGRYQIYSGIESILEMINKYVTNSVCQ